MRFIFAMAGIAIRRCFRKICECARIGVTLRADRVYMFAGQLKCSGMGKVFSKTIHAIVTVQTSVAVSERMSQRKG